MSTELTSQNEVDPLSGAASGWEAPKFPVLAGNKIYEFKILSCKKHRKENSDSESLAITLETTKDYLDDEDKPLRAGFKGFTYIGITPVEPTTEKPRGRTWKQIGADLGMVLKAAGFGQKEPRDLVNDPSVVEGSIVLCRVGIKKETAEFPKGNTFKFHVEEGE